MRKLFTYLTIALGAFPLFRLNHFSILMILWIVVACYLGMNDFFNKKLFITSKKLIIWFISTLLFWIYIAYFPTIHDGNEYGKILVKSLPILLFSTGFMLTKHLFSASIIDKILFVFVGATFLLNSWGWYGVMDYGWVEAWQKNDFYHPTFRTIFSEYTRLHIPYLGLFTAFSVLYLFYQFLQNHRYRILMFFAVIGMIFSLYIYSARMALVIVFCGSLYLIWQQISSKLWKWILSIALPLVAITIVWFSPIKERYTQSFSTEWVLPHAGQEPHEVNYRYGIWHCSKQLLQQNIWFGVGVDRVQASLNTCYEQFTYRSYEDFTQKTYNTHNQYIDWMLKFGILMGLLVVWSVFRWTYKADKVYHLFLIAIALAFTTENLLDRQMGVVFYSLFNAIFVWYKKDTFEKSTSSRLVR